jgi:hypothetical protein
MSLFATANEKTNSIDASQETCLYSLSNKLSGKKGLGMGKFYAFLPVFLNYCLTKK